MVHYIVFIVRGGGLVEYGRLEANSRHDARRRLIVRSPGTTFFLVKSSDFSRVKT